MTVFSTFIIDTDDISRELLELYLDELDYINVDDTSSELKTVFNRILEKKPQLVFLDITHAKDEDFKMIEKIKETNEDTTIVVTSKNSETGNFVKAMRAGAKDFATKPIIKEKLYETCEKIKEQILNPDKSSNCKVITAFSNKGGIGKTSIATNLALEIANITKEKVALVDLNMQIGDVSTFLDMKPSFDVSHVIKNLKKDDPNFLISNLDQYKDTSLYVLADTPYMEQNKNITPEQITELFEALRKVFSYVVVDTSNSFDPNTVSVLDNTDFIMLVTIVNLPAIRNCQRCLDIFDRLGYDKDKTKIVINRYMENEEVNAADVENALDKKVYWKIPNNYFTIMTSINKGIPICEVNPTSNIAQSYRELATVLADNIYKQKIASKIERDPSIDLKELTRYC